MIIGATNVLLRPLSHLVARGESKAEMEIWYLVVIACRKNVEADIRARIMHAFRRPVRMQHDGTRMAHGVGVIVRQHLDIVTG